MIEYVCKPRSNTKLNTLPSRQQGASAITTIIILAVLGYAVYVGMQYVPQAIESKSVDSVLNTVQTDQKANPAMTESDVKEKVVRLLQINEMNDMIENVSVKRSGGRTTVTVKYDRELNLVYKKHQMHYEKSVTL
jgi:hypothetical protein